MEEKNEGLSLKDLLAILWKNIIWIASIVGVGIVCTIAYILVAVTPTYTASATLLVDAKAFASSSSSSDVAGGLRATQTVADWVIENSVCTQAVEDLKTSNKAPETLTAGALKSGVSVKTSTSTLFITVKYTSKNATYAVDYLNALIDAGLTKANDTTILKDSYICTSYATKASNTGHGKTYYLALGGVASVVVALGVVFLKEVLKTKFSTVEEVENTLDIKSLGITISPKGKEVNPELLKTTNEYNYEKIITNIDYSRVDNNLKVLEVTSFDIGDGKTSFAANVAQQLSKANRKSLVIELDLRRNRIHKEFNIINEKGISDIITNQVTKEEAIVHIDENIDVITAGTKVPNPTIILQSETLKNLIEEVKGNYEYVILDCPPLFASSDAKIVSGVADGVIVIASAGNTNISHAKHDIKDFRSANPNIIGCVVTHVNKKNSSYYSYYKKKYYKEEK